jgi:hypothetical protein
MNRSSDVIVSSAINPPPSHVHATPLPLPGEPTVIPNRVFEPQRPEERKDIL